MKILFIGDIVAGPGRKAVKQLLPQIKSEYKVDLVIANAENLSGGRGITEEKINEMQVAGVDFFTGGDHIFWERDTETLLEKLPVIRPANYPGQPAGKGFAVIDAGKHGKVLVINLMGRTSYSSTFSYLDDPFRKLDTILESYDRHELKEFAAILVDFHADSTSEKQAFSFYADGRVTAVLGTHTHVPTADPWVLPKGTMYVTDVGMTGAINSVLGVKKEVILNLFLTAQNQRFEWEKSGIKAFRSVLLDTDQKKIFRIDNVLDS